MGGKQQKLKKSKEERRSDEPDDPLMRLAHEIFVKKIGPARLTLEEAVDVVAYVVKAIVISNTDDDDPEDRSGMIAWIEERFIDALADIDPSTDQADQTHVWLVPPQGLITEPFGIMWSGAHEENSVQTMIGTELVSLREEISEMKDAGVHVIEGVEGVAIIDPEWDGEPTVPCENPQCSNTHDVHLLVAENLFTLAKQHSAQRAAPN
jgi:hypothetical protein